MLSKATKTDLEKLKIEWTAICSNYGDEGSVLANDINAKIDSLIKEISQANYFAYVIKDGEKFDALLNVVHALPKSDVSWLKIFDMLMTPEYILGDGNLSALIDTLAASIIEPIELIFGDEHGNAREIKTYARTENMVKLFKSLENNKLIQEKLGNIGLVCLQEGNWLIFRKK
jgi:RNAse (barnase) inhibitor barstar